MQGRNVLFVAAAHKRTGSSDGARDGDMEDIDRRSFRDDDVLVPRDKEGFKTETARPSYFRCARAPGSGPNQPAIAGDKVMAPRFGQFRPSGSILRSPLGLRFLVQDEEWGTGRLPDA